MAWELKTVSFPGTQLHRTILWYWVLEEQSCNFILKIFWKKYLLMPFAKLFFKKLVKLIEYWQQKGNEKLLIIFLLVIKHKDINKELKTPFYYLSSLPDTYRYTFMPFRIWFTSKTGGCDRLWICLFGFFFMSRLSSLMNVLKKYILQFLLSWYKTNQSPIKHRDTT